MNAIAGPPILDALRAALAFEADGEAVGNLTVGRGRVRERHIRAALVENRVASGALGRAECERLAEMIRIAAAERSPLVLFLDSAGAKLSEGLGALGSFRTLYRAALDAELAGAPFVAVLGRNCYGGASMLAQLASRRIFAADTRLAMSGPSIVAAAAGVDVLDEVFRAMSDATMSAAARAKASPANAVWTPSDDLGGWLAESLRSAEDAPAALRARHDSLARRLENPSRQAPTEALHRRDLERVYPDGHEAREDQGFVEGRGMVEGAAEAFVGLVGKSALGAARAWRFAEAIWRHTQAPPERLAVFVDCASHSARLEDEKIVLSEFIADMGCALAALVARGTRVRLVILGKASGGVYVALAAPVAEVSSVYGADIQVLPGAAVAAILGSTHESVPTFAEYRSAGVAESEIKLGLVPGAP